MDWKPNKDSETVFYKNMTFEFEISQQKNSFFILFVEKEPKEARQLRFFYNIKLEPANNISKELKNLDLTFSIASKLRMMLSIWWPTFRIPKKKEINIIINTINFSANLNQALYGFMWISFAEWNKNAKENKIKTTFKMEYFKYKNEDIKKLSEKDFVLDELDQENLGKLEFKCKYMRHAKLLAVKALSV